MTLNERIENLEVVENFVMEEENTQYAPESPVAQSSSVVADESRHSGETKTPRSIVTGDESIFAIEMAVNEREDEFESAEEEQIVTGNDEDEDDDKEYEEPQPIAVIKASEYCLLCRARFPLFDCLNEANRNLYNDRLEENPNEPWQSQIRAVLRLNKEGRGISECNIPQIIEHYESTFVDGESIAVTNVVELKGDVIQASLVGWPPSGNISIIPVPTLYEHMDAFAGCFHDWCYSIFTWKFGPDKLELLCQMAKSLQPSCAWERPAEMNGSLYSQLNCDSLLSSVDSISAEFQPFFLAKLPLELRSQIWNLVGPTSAYSALMLVTGETSTLAHQVQNPAIRKLKISPGDYIEARIINMYGTQYLQNLTTQKVSTSGVKIAETVIRIQVVSNIHGICSIRFLGQNWRSKWLGTIPPRGCCWHGGNEFATNLSDGGWALENDNLTWLYNGLAIDELEAESKPLIQQVMWDRPEHPDMSFDADGTLFTLFDPEHLYNRRLPLLRFFRFIPLISDGVYISGLTVHFLSKSITGIEAHFPTTSNLVGSRGTVALYFPLAPNERISNVWLRLDSSSAVQSVPSMLIRTTLGRDYTFGPYIGPTYYQDYRWVMLKQIGCIVGLYFENSNKIRRLGVIGDGHLAEVGEVPLPRYETCDPTLPFIGFLGRSLFMNDARIHDLESVIICRVGRRCIGMLIHYVDTNVPAIVLGQWLDSKHSKHVCIYDKNDLTSSSPSIIAFKLSESEKFVQDIEFCVSESEFKVGSDVHVQIYDIGMRIAWWFTGDKDSIRLWMPRLNESSNIPVEYELVQD